MKVELELTSTRPYIKLNLMPQTPNQTRDTDYNYRFQKPGKNKFRLLILFFLAVTLFIGIGLFAADKIGLKKIDNPATKDVNSQDVKKEMALKFANEVLKPNFRFDQTDNFQRNTLVSSIGVIFQSQKKVNNQAITLTYEEAPNGELWGLSVLVEESGFDKPQFDTILATLDKYYTSLPSTKKEDWIRVFPYKGDIGIETFEIATNNKDGTKDTKSAYLVVYNEKPDTITVAACRLFEGNPDFQKSTCFD